MIKGIIGCLLGIAIAFVLEFLGVNTYIIQVIQPCLTFELDTYYFYMLCGFLGAVAGILPW